MDQALHSHFAFEPQAMPIATDQEADLVFRSDTGWPTSSGSVGQNKEKSYPANTAASLCNNTLLNASTTELFDSSFPWTTIPQNELDNPVFQSNEETMMPFPKSQRAAPQLNSFSEWFDSQPSNLPLTPRSNTDLPSSNALLDASSPPDCRTNAKISPPSCNCFTTCLQSLQALHNHSSTTRLASAFDMALTINQKAVEGCASMLACRECISTSGSNTTAMLLATIMEKILSFYQVVTESDFNDTTGTDAQMSISGYRVASEDGRWLRNEILWRELRKLEDLFGRFREVCGRNKRDKDAGFYSTLLGHLSNGLEITYEELRLRQNTG
ncbi:hypothetical protein V491_02719 [Pseudogymnoascus sp. VKM F-3775]|nr:hypothetical protein V491_02719 [Pseudogymnoascus sp. VKM F-3775]